MLTSNFGLYRADFIDCRIRSGRRRHDFYIIEDAELSEFLWTNARSAIERFTLQYFEIGHLLDGGPDVDNALNIRNWSKDSRNPSSFIELLGAFTEFITRLYTSDKLLSHSLVVFHEQCKSIQSDDVSESLFGLNVVLSGANLVVARLLEDFVDRVHECGQVVNDEVIVLSDGPYDRGVYEANFAPLIQNFGVKIGRIIPRNSADIHLITGHLEMVGVIGWLLSTRTRVELRRIHEKVKKNSRKPAGSSENVPPTIGLAVIGADHPRMKELLHLQCLLPFTSLLITLNLAVPSNMIGSLRRVVRNILFSIVGEGGSPPDNPVEQSDANHIIN